MKCILGGFLVMMSATSVQAQTAVFKGSASFVIKAEHVEAFQHAVAEIIAPTRAEAGCLSYEAYRVVNEDGTPTLRFEFHEVWKTREAMMIDHKENSKHMQKFFNEIAIGTDHSYVESFRVNGEYVTVLP